jgi:hypothetical protein
MLLVVQHHHHLGMPVLVRVDLSMRNGNNNFIGLEEDFGMDLPTAAIIILVAEATINRAIMIGK